MKIVAKRYFLLLVHVSLSYKVQENICNPIPLINDSIYSKTTSPRRQVVLFFLSQQNGERTIQPTLSKSSLNGIYPSPCCSCIVRSRGLTGTVMLGDRGPAENI